MNSPEEALEQMMQREKEMAKEAAKMIERVRRLQDISYCVESNHDWIVEEVTQNTSHTKIDFARIACTSCDAFFNVARTNEQSATITDLFMDYNGKSIGVQAFLDNIGGEEE
jgi:hypothetical protein